MKNLLTNVTRTFAFLAMFFLTFQLNAQNSATIAGKVIDKITGETLIGVTIQVNNASGLVTGTVTDYDGNYNIKVPEGTYDLMATYLTYQTMKIEKFDAKANVLNTLDFPLSEKTVDIAEVVIVAEKVRNTDASVIALQRRSFSIQDGLSSQQISRSALSNAADAMKQVTGAVVEGGKYIVMRGLGDRYSISQLNGITMPSTDPYRNSSSLDLIPSQMIDNIITLKTFTPDLPGNFSGGLVNVTTKSFPDKFNLYFGLNSSFNTQSTMNSNFLGHGSDKGKYDWLGYDDGGREIPDILKSEENRALLSQNSYINARKASAEYDGLRNLLNESSRALSNVFMPTKQSTPLNHGFNFSVGNNIKMNKNVLGFSFGVNYSREFNHYDNGAINTYSNNGFNLFTEQSLTESKSVETPHVGALANVSYKFGSNHVLSANVIYNNDTDIIGRQQSGSFVGKLSDPNAIYNTSSLEFTQRNYISSQISGKHVFPKLFNSEINWCYSQNKSTQIEPDSRYFAYTKSVDEDGNDYFSINEAEFRPPFHFFRDLEDNAREAKVDFTIPFLTKGNAGSSNIIKFGGMYSATTRSFSEYQFQHTRHSGVPSTLFFSQFNGDINAFLDYKNFGVIDTVDTGNNPYKIGYHYINQINNKNFYEGSQDLGAAYVMSVYNVTPKLKLIAGVRMETTNLNVVSRDTTLNPSNLDLTDFLYSLNTIYSINAKSNIRLAASRTLARPNMRELAPFEQFDTKNGFFNIGNPNLKRTLINNYDIRYEIYPNLGEMIAVSAFYKQFYNPILRQFSPTATTPELGYVNIDKADVYGVELEVRKNLGFIGGGIMDRFNIATNVALIKSFYKIPEVEVNASKSVDPTYDLTTRPFQGQAPFIVNAMLSYSDLDKGLETALSFNVSGRRLYNISLAATPDVYEEIFPILNYTFSKKFATNYQISLSARNLLNPISKKTQTYNNINYVSEAYRLGSSFGVTLAYFIR